jgi:hypothetical protein
VLRRLLIVLVVFLIAVVIAVDRVGELVAARVLASKIETDEHLPSRPSVSIGGVPFVTQVLGGNYHSVSVTAHEVPVEHVPVTTLIAHLHDAHIPFGHLIRGSVSKVPVDRVTGSAFVSFDDANRYLATHSPAGSLVRLVGSTNGSLLVTDRVRLGGRPVTLRGVATLTVSLNVVRVGLDHLTGAAPRLISRALGPVSVTLPLQGLPFRIVLESVSVTSAGVLGKGGAKNVVLGS